MENPRREPTETGSWYVGFKTRLRSRTWRLVVPLHLIAFLVLYLATYQLMRHAVIAASAETARRSVDHEVSELGIVLPGPGHLFAALFAAHEEMELGLFDATGATHRAGLAVSQQVVEEVRDFATSGEEERIWVDSRGGRRSLRVIRSIEAGRDCAGCHTDGGTIGIVSLSLDLTPQLERVHGPLLRNLAVLIFAWAVLVTAMNAVVQRSVKRSARRLKEDLVAAEAGSTDLRSAAELPLDPVSAELHRSLREFLRHQREREIEVVARLEHSDRLASLGQLAAGLAHEIKNPLAGIQGALEILRDDQSDGKTVGLYDEMLGELDRVNGTLKSLLAQARPTPATLSEVDVPQLLEDVRVLLEPGLRRRGVDLVLEIAEGVATARLDAGKIRQVMVNLVTNAAQAIENGGRIALRAAPFPEGEGVILAVADNGPGIESDDLERVFQPFFTTKFTGTGLGLSIARRLAEQHGGSLEVESRSGQGATFLVLLPTQPSEDELVEKGA